MKLVTMVDGREMEDVNIKEFDPSRITYKLISQSSDEYNVLLSLHELMMVDGFRGVRIFAEGTGGSHILFGYSRLPERMRL
jgi:hypothetical protein